MQANCLSIDSNYLPFSCAQISFTEQSLEDKLVDKINNELTPDRERKNIKKWEKRVAPTGPIIKDVAATIGNDYIMFADKEASNILSLKAVEGHAQNGHGRFNHNRYPNTTTTDILSAIEERGLPILGEDFSATRFRETTQGYIDSIVHLMEDWFKQVEENLDNLHLVSRYITLDSPLAGMSCFKGMKLDALEFARGFYLSTRMDTLKGVRSVGFERYGWQAGGGECHLVSMENLKRYGIGIYSLSKIMYHNSFKEFNNMSHSSRLKILKKLGIIKEKSLPLEDIAAGEYTWKKIKAHPEATNLIENPEYQGLYIREEKGQGVGDDIEIRLAGSLPPTIFEDNYRESRIAVQSKILGALLGDKIDTDEKSTKYFLPGGQDEIAGLQVNGKYGRLAQDKRVRKRFHIKERPDNDYNLVPDDEVVDFTMAGVNIQTGKRNQLVHSSQRWFYKNVNNTCAISEILKHTYHHSLKTRQKVDLNKLRGFQIDPNANYNQSRFTFSQIPLYKINEIFDERLALVADPTRIKERLTEYFAKTQ